MYAWLIFAVGFLVGTTFALLVLTILSVAGLDRE